MAKLGWWIYNHLAAGLLLLIKSTLRFEVTNQPQQEPVIYAFWHRNLMYCALQRAGDPITVMISSSRDGELIAGPVAKLGYYVVRGSSSRQGSQALKAMLRSARQRSLGITPDGPKGPIATIHPGVFQIAQMAAIPIIAVACDANKEWIFNSWDKFRFPKPFARVIVEYSDPIWVSNKDDFSRAEAAYRRFMQDFDLHRPVANT